MISETLTIHISFKMIDVKFENDDGIIWIKYVLFFHLNKFEGV